MAKVSKVVFSGHIGNTIYYELYGKPCSRAMPKRVRQTKATMESGKLFGHAMQVAADIRQGLKAILAGNGDRQTRYRIDNAILQWMRQGKPASADPERYRDTWPELSHLSFINKSAIGAYVKAPITVNWSNPQQALLQLPAMNLTKVIHAPAHTEVLHWMVTITGATIADPAVTQTHNLRFDMPYDDNMLPARDIPLECSIVPDSLTVVAISLKYSVRHKRRLEVRLEDAWKPAWIIAAHYEAPTPAMQEIEVKRPRRRPKTSNDSPVIYGSGTLFKPNSFSYFKGRGEMHLWFSQIEKDSS